MMERRIMKNTNAKMTLRQLAKVTGASYRTVAEAVDAMYWGAK
jgi:hypothetical protein